MRRLILICHVVFLVIMPLRMAYAELRLETWKSYGAMAEQGGVCAAFARLMELQSIIDVKQGNLWLERRKFAGTLIRQASILEGLPPAEQDDIDILINSYTGWLISNLNSEDATQSFDNVAHSAATKMIDDVCSSLYARADMAIMEAHPELAACPAIKAPEPQICAAETMTQHTQVKANATATLNDAQELKRARDEITMLTVQNKSLRAKLRRLRAPALAVEMKTPSTNNEMPPNSSPEAESTDYTHLAASPPMAKENHKADSHIETDNDALTSLTGRSKRTAPNVDIMLPNEQGQGDRLEAEKSGGKTAKTKTRRRRTVSNLFVAQLGSYASSEQANEGIHYLKSTFKDTFKVLELSVVSKTSRSGQRIYDLVTEKSERSEIENVCNSLWEQRFGCFVTAAN